VKKITLILSLIIFIISGCSAYKEISPNPEIKSDENGFIKIKDEKKDFELDKEKKYVIEFPPAKYDNFILEFKSNLKGNSDYFFLGKFEDDKIENPIYDELNDNSEMSGFSINKAKENYFFVIDKIANNKNLVAEYRYLPNWRFKVEESIKNEKSQLVKNSVDRNEYNNLNYRSEINIINQKLNELQLTIPNLQMISENLAKTETIIPDSMITKKDQVYRDLVLFSSDVEEEFLFQKKNLSLFQAFVQLRKTEGSTEDFLKSASTLLSFLTNRTSIDESVRNEIKAIIARRINGIENYYLKVIQNKKDIKPFNLLTDIKVVFELYTEATGSKSSKLENLVDFFDNWDRKTTSFEEFQIHEKSLNSYLFPKMKWMPNNYYSGASRFMQKMNQTLPEIYNGEFREFEQNSCVINFIEKVSEAKKSSRKIERELKEADILLAQINNLAETNSYEMMLSVLKKHPNLDFMKQHFQFLDEEYLSQKDVQIKNYINRKSWEKAEENIRNLAYFNGFINEMQIKDKHRQILNLNETMIYERIKDFSRTKIDSFVIAHINTNRDVDLLYKNEVFNPPYIFTYSVLGEQTVTKRNENILTYLDQMKYFTFPEKSINLLYDSIIRTSSKNADKAKSIIEHGKMYKGEDKRTKNIIDEFNPNIAKWITKAKDYRKVYVVPVTENHNGKNQYKFRIQLKIPSDAEFPVYEINIKLPEEIAQNASNAKWYDSMKLNNEEILNEGRVQIFAPTSANDYEFKVSPVQMDSEGRNILDVTFTYPKYELFEVSVMAQKPIMRKN